METEGTGRLPPVYLDYAATAPMRPRVVARMAEVLAMPPGNSSSNHASGRAAHDLVEFARGQVAALVGADPADIVFTSGATESNNLAIAGTLRAALARGRKPHVVSMATEHKSVLEPLRALQSQGVAVTLLKPDSDGLLHADALAAAITPDTCLVSLLHVNNETGVAQDVAALRGVCAARAVPLHIDAAQSAGKLPLRVDGLALLSFTAHKLGGPQGIGALYVAPAHRGGMQAQMLGGGHERGMRAGTLATHQIVGFGLACFMAAEQREREAARVGALRQTLWQGLQGLPGVLLNGHPDARAPGILNVTFGGVEGESLFAGLQAEVAVSTGSACSSRSGEPSYVLRALGRDTTQAQESLRFSLGWGSTREDVDMALAAVQRVHATLWNQSPVRPLGTGDWEMAGGQILLGEAGSQRLGTWVRLAAWARDGVVRDVRFQVYGCPHTVAACKLVAAELRNSPLRRLPPGAPEKWRESVDAPVEKLGQMLIIEDALAALCRTAVPEDPIAPPWPSP